MTSFALTAGRHWCLADDQVAIVNPDCRLIGLVVLTQAGEGGLQPQKEQYENYQHKSQLSLFK